MDKKQEKMLKQYEDQRPVYEEFTEYCKKELQQFITDIGLDSLCDQVKGRAKDIPSFRQKLLDNPKYKRLEQCRDLSGIRAVFYVDSAISTFFSRVALDQRIRSLECKFLDKVYLVPHFLRQFVELKVSEEAIARSPELKKFEGLLCELQVRDSLQNAWANVYHQTMYKCRNSLEKEFAEDMAVIDQRYESMVQGPLREVSNNIDYLYKAGLELSQGHKFFSADIVKQVRECSSLSQLWNLLNDLNGHIRVFGPKFHDDESVVRSLEEMHSLLERLPAPEHDKHAEWLLSNAIEKIISIACGLFYLLPERVCQFFEVLIEQRPQYHKEINEELKSLIGYDRSVISQNSYAAQLFLAKWIARASGKNRVASQLWLGMLSQLLKMELSGVSRSSVETFSIQRGIPPYHAQLEEVRKVCFGALLSLLAAEREVGLKVMLIRWTLHALRPPYHYEQFETGHRAMYENELKTIVAYFDGHFDGMTMQELIAFEVEAEEVAYWFEQCELDTGCLTAFISKRLQNQDYLSLRAFVGHERRKVLSEETHTCKLSALVADISTENWLKKRELICRVAALCPDLGHGEFEVFEGFLECLALEKSSLAFDLLKSHIVALGCFAKFLIPNLYLSEFKEEVVTLLQGYIENKIELEAIVQGLSRIRPAPIAVVDQLLDVLLQAKATHLIYVVVSTLQRMSENWDREQTQRLFFKCVEFLSSQRHFDWVDRVLYEGNPLFASFEPSEFEQVLKLLLGIDNVHIGVDYVLSKVLSKDSGAVLRFFVDRKKAIALHMPMHIWPSHLQMTKSVLAKLGLNKMCAFYVFLKKELASAEGDFAFRLFPQLMSLSAASLLELIDLAKSRPDDLKLVLRILQQYPDDPVVLGHYKSIVSECKLEKSQILAICSQLIFVGQYAGREGRLNQLQARQSIVNAWGADQNPNVKKFLTQFSKAMDTAIKDEQAGVSRERFNDTAAFQDGVKRFT